MLTTDEARAHVGHAVLVDVRDGPVLYRVLTSITPHAELVLADERGHTTFVTLGDVLSVEDGRVPCHVCGALVNRVFLNEGDTAQRCATCSRAHARTLPPPKELCETCGVEGAFYSPRNKRFGCASCHAKADALTGLGVERRVLEAAVAACKGADTEDARHRWVHIKGRRWHCKHCPARRFTDPQLGTIWRD